MKNVFHRSTYNTNTRVFSFFVKMIQIILPRNKIFTSNDTFYTNFFENFRQLKKKN